MTNPDGARTLSFPDAPAFEAWLDAHHTLQEGIWLKIAKKASGIPSVTQPEALDACLCYGWIDGQRKSFDATHYLQKYTPRRPRSLWSAVNIRKIEGLTAAGRMREPGRAAVAAAKADGRWDAAYASMAEATVPPDLDAALDANPAARAFFDTLDRASRYSVLWRLMTAGTPATRTARLTRMITTLAEGRRV